MQFRDLPKQYQVLKDKIDAAMYSVAASAHFIAGPEVKELEKILAEYVGVKHCITCANGTDAITIAMRAYSTHPVCIVGLHHILGFQPMHCRTTQI